ncbi:acidic repeat-containing protein isoform X2 [Oryzias melastigma]|uniref:Germ cell nuclear acidic peptidase n=1 Tax=Oryzias melastigma TaxID=30732 RepID=A0A3B3D926_ORYME|nr:acidic repeat-containing protein isoform X2 [Oryzias melastigma]
MDELMNFTEKTPNAASNHYRKAFTMMSDSSDDEFEQFLEQRFTPQAKASSLKPRSAAKPTGVVLVVSSDDEDDSPFETFLQRVKTPITKPRRPESGSGDSLKDFIVDDNLSDDDFIKTKSSFRGPKKGNTPASQHSFRRPLSQFNSPVFVSDSEDDEDNIVIRSSWKVRHSKPVPKVENHHREEENLSPSPPLPPSPLFSHPPGKASASILSPKRTFSAPSRLDESSSSEEEFVSLLERLKKKNIVGGTLFTPKTSKESNKEPVVSTPPVQPSSTSKTLKKKPQHVKTPAKTPFLKPTVSQTEPRRGPASRLLCKTPGCFLESLSNPASNYSSSFKKNKEELTSKLFQLYNSSVFDNKLPVDMSVTWNKKMRKTAGYCVTGQEKGGGSRYARIELSEKVCDSADRLRDTLIHELCHAATWLINGVRDGHGAFWKLYARKATVMHPELPMVTRCHSYDITYKFKYQCTRCQNTIGRHSKSLDTQKFVCALCTGRLVLLTPSKPRAPTPFANFVKENYGSVRQELAGQSHAEGAASNPNDPIQARIFL